jgi:hypothetical protein
MRMRQASRLVGLAGLACWLASAPARATSPDAGQPPGAPVVHVGPSNCLVLSLKSLACLSRAELEQLYLQAGPGTIATGYARGRAIHCPGTRLARTRSWVTNLLWRGKIFHDDCTMVNRWCAGKAITANVYYGESWLDGKPSIILDYCGTSRVWADVRDEIREVAPGLFLGLMFERRCPEPHFRMFFALEAKPVCP